MEMLKSAGARYNALSATDSIFIHSRSRDIAISLGSIYTITCCAYILTA